MYENMHYSLTRYSVNQADKALAVEERFSEAMGSLAGAAVPVDIREHFAEAAQGSARGTASVVSALSLWEGLGSLARMSADVLVRAAFNEALQGFQYGRKNIPATLKTGERLEGLTWAAKDIPTRLVLAGQLGSRAAGVKDIVETLTAYEMFTALMEATSQMTEQAIFQIIIPPGGELRIDGELFTVLLNGENALHTQSGDWIDVSRELLRLNIESASGGRLEGQLIYTERYL